MKNSDRDFEKNFHPDQLRTTLLRVALYVLAFESFRSGIIEHLRVLHFSRYDERGWHVDEHAYAADVLARDPKHRPFRASLAWFRHYDAIDDTDLKAVERFTSVRNRLVHQLWKTLGTIELPSDLETFSELIRVYRKIEVWRIVNIELDSDPYWNGKEIIEEEIQPGPLIMLQMLWDTALGKEEEAWAFYNALVDARGKNPPQNPSRSDPT
jgi:hypothetical protein